MKKQNSNKDPLIHSLRVNAPTKKYILELSHFSLSAPFHTTISALNFNDAKKQAKIMFRFYDVRVVKEVTW